MKITAISTGVVQVTEAFLDPPIGWRRQLSLFLPSPFQPPMPIHCWLIEHGADRILVDTGETAGARDQRFARFELTKDDELPGQLRKLGVEIDTLDNVILTHMHGDHMDGAVHLSGMPVHVSAVELEFVRSPFARLTQRLLHQPVPVGVDFRSFELVDGPFGAFPHSRRLSDDGRIVAVPTPGHTPGHISVICIDDDGRHVFLAGDASDTLEQLHAQRADAVASEPVVQIETLRTILAHAKSHPTVYLPSHDPGSADRLAATETVVA